MLIQTICCSSCVYVVIGIQMIWGLLRDDTSCVGRIRNVFIKERTKILGCTQLEPDYYMLNFIVLDSNTNFPCDSRCTPYERCRLSKAITRRLSCWRWVLQVNDSSCLDIASQNIKVLGLSKYESNSEKPSRAVCMVCHLCIWVCQSLSTVS